MKKIKILNRIKFGCSSRNGDIKCGYRFTRLAMLKHYFNDTAEIDSIVSALQAKGFLFILCEEIDGEINLVFENANNLFVFEAMIDSTMTHEESCKMLSEYMDEAVQYPYKLIP